ncbi:MAG: motility protein A [Acidimicrobiales bacterium]
MPATLVGFLVALVLVMMGAQTHHVSPVFLVSNITALLIVPGGALGATMASYEFTATTGIFGAIMKALLGKDKPVDMEKTITTLVEFARKARGEGLLALESEMAGLDDPFMKRGLQLAIDGSDPDAVAQVMKAEIKAMKVRHKLASDWCQSYGIFAPTFGIIGAVIGLIATLGELDHPEKLGSGIAGAFVATFLGVFLANGVMLPFSARMKRMSAQEVQAREMVVEGVLAIQGGQNPRVIEETLMSYLSPKEAEAMRSSSGG